MAGQTGNNNSNAWKLISGAFNTENNPFPGVGIGALSGSIISQYGGFLGTKQTLDADDAGKVSNAAIGTLYSGTYQYVKIASAATQSNLTRGRLVFWDTTATEDAYQVTNDETQNGGSPLLAGVLIGAPTAGNYAIIQVAGRITAQMRAAVTAATRWFAWAAAGAGVDNATFDSMTGATALLQSNNYASNVAIGEAVGTNGGLIIANLLKMINRN